jgi:hypothetical protein
MLVRNAYTGALHEVPNQQLYEVGEPVYDGFGNPVGGIFDDIVGAVKNVVSAPIQAATSMLNPMNALNPIGAVGNILGNIIPGMGPSPQAAAPAPAGGMMPWAPGFPPRPMPYFRPPLPTGWQHAPLPYTGLGPKRLYMRCAVWPGPSGLVPGYAANMTPQQQQALMPPPPGAGGYGGGRRHHGGRRRRR